MPMKPPPLSNSRATCSLFSNIPKAWQQHFHAQRRNSPPPSQYFFRKLSGPPALGVATGSPHYKNPAAHAARPRPLARPTGNRKKPTMLPGPRPAHAARHFAFIVGGALADNKRKFLRDPPVLNSKLIESLHPRGSVCMEICSGMALPARNTSQSATRHPGW